MVNEKFKEIIKYGLKKTEVGEELINWYKSVINKKVNYVIFANENIYKLFLLLEKYTGIKMNDTNNKKYMTSQAFLACSKEIYDKEEFPNILVCGEHVHFASELVFFADKLIKILKKLYPNYDTYDLENKIREKSKYETLVWYDGAGKTDDLYMFKKSHKVPLLFPSNLFNSSKFKISFDKGYKCLTFLNIVYELNSLANIPACTYIEKIDNNSYNKINLKEYKEIESLGLRHEEHINVKPLKANGKILGFCTLDIIKNSFDNSYFVKPLFLIDGFDNNVSKKLYKKIIEIAKKKGYKDLFLKQLNEISNIDICINEWMSLIINIAIINEFNSENNIQISKDQINEILNNLSRNYRLDIKEDSIKYLKDLIEKPIIIDIKELNTILNDIIPDENRIDILSHNKKTDIYERIYNLFMLDIIKLYKISSSNEDNNFSLDMRRDFLKFLLNGKNEEEMKEGISYIVSLLNEGYINLSNFKTGCFNKFYFNEHTIDIWRKKYWEVFGCISPFMCDINRLWFLIFYSPLDNFDYERKSNEFFDILLTVISNYVTDLKTIDKERLYEFLINTPFLVSHDLAYSRSLPMALINKKFIDEEWYKNKRIQDINEKASLFVLNYYHNSSDYLRDIIEYVYEHRYNDKKPHYNDKSFEDIRNILFDIMNDNRKSANEKVKKIGPYQS